MSKQAFNLNADLNQITDEEKFTLLISALKSNDFRQFKEIIKSYQNNEYLGQSDAEGNNILHLIAENNWIAFLYEIAEAVSIEMANSTNRNGETPLHLAAKNNHPETVLAFITLGSDVRIANTNGQIAMQLVDKKNHQNTYDLLRRKTESYLKKEDDKEYKVEANPGSDYFINNNKTQLSRCKNLLNQITPNSKVNIIELNYDLSEKNLSEISKIIQNLGNKSVTIGQFNLNSPEQLASEELIKALTNYQGNIENITIELDPEKTLELNEDQLQVIKNLINSPARQKTKFDFINAEDLETKLIPGSTTTQSEARKIEETQGAEGPTKRPKQNHR